MTLFKKSLALVLAIAMIFSTMSVMGYAANDGSAGIEYFAHMNADGTVGTHTDGNGYEFVVKFFRQVDGEWVETEKAAPGEKVIARVFVGTEFDVTSSVVALTAFDLNYLDITQKGSNYGLTVNTNNKSGISFTSFSVGSTFEDPYKNAKLKPYFTKPGIKDDGSGNVTESYFVPYSYFKDADGNIDKGIVIAGSSIDTSSKIGPLDVSDWTYSLEFTVKSNDYVRNPENKGFVSVPLEFASQKEIKDGVYGAPATGITNIAKVGSDAGDLNTCLSFEEWYTYGETTPGYISVHSNATFDPVAEEGGYFADNSATKVVSGVIGEDNIPLGSVTPLNDQGKKFVGWSLTKGGEVISASEYATLFYDYEDVTFYAVWEDDVVTTYYTYEVYQMNPDGTYPEAPFSQSFYEKAGETVTVKATDAPENFYLDTTAPNILTGVVNADNSTVLRAYFARNKYNVRYHFADNNGPQTEKIEVFYGQPIPEFEAVPGGPVVPGKTFEGWSTSETENVAPPVVMPGNDIDLYPIYSDNLYTYVYDADGGKFADDEEIKSFVYKYGETPAAFDEIPVKEGYEFSCWDEVLPATVTGDLTFTAIYNVGNYTVTFVDSEGKVLSEETFEYGTEISEAYIPEGYKADAWTLDNGVAAEFPFTLTENVTLTAADDANLYKVTFLVDGEVYEEYQIESGSSVVVPDEDPADKTGYTFAMWSPDPNGQVVDEEDLVFEAIFVKGEYVLSFDTDGGTPVDAITAVYGENIADKLPGENATTKEGYTFAGWDTKLPETMPGENTVVKALWTANAYSVKFVNGLTGAEIETVTGEFGATVIAPALPEEAGYTFAWDVTPPATIPAKNEKGEVMANGGVMTVTAVPTAADVTITFNTNGGTPAEMAQIGGKAHADITPAITEPTPPAGMYFAGWDDGKGNVVETPVKFPAESLTLTAVYKNNSYTATYDPDGGVFADNTTANKTFTVEYGAEVPAPAAPTKKNFVFKGWSPVVTTMPAKDTTFTAQWEPIGPVDYTITVYAVNPATGDYLDAIVSNYKAEAGTKLQILEKGSVVPEGVTAIWYEDLYTSSTNVPDVANAGNVLSVEIDSDADNALVAYFKLATYSAAFDANGGAFTNAPADDARYDGNQFVAEGTYGEAVELPVEPEKEGYDFVGWKDGETGFVYTDTVPAFAGDVDYSAEWEIKTYDITFTVTDEEGNVVFEETVTFEHGEDVVAPEYTPEDGYKFDGWDIPAGTKAEDSDDYSNAADLIEYDVKYVAITGVPAGAAIPEATTKTIKDTFDVGTATVPAGYTFNGWFINSASGAKADATYTMTAAPVTFYGEFTANTYNINYDVAGGDYLASTPVVFGTPVTDITVPTKEGYTFKGWVDAKGEAITDNTGKVIDTEFTMPAEDILLKATWEKNPTFHNVIYTYNIAGIAAVPETATNVQAGTTYTLAAAPADTAEYRFTGWFYNSNKVTEIVMPAADAHIIGIWEPIVAETFTLTLDANGGKFADNTDKNESQHQKNADISAFNALVPAREGYTFKGWDQTLTVMPGEALTVKAVWEVEKYVINFNTNGGSDVAPMDVTFGQTVTAPADPTKDGYKFVAWTPALPTVMGDIGETGASMTVEAIWEALDNTISFDADGGQAVADMNVKTGETVSQLPVTTKEGSEFLGWMDASGQLVTDNTGRLTAPFEMPADDLEFTASWKVNTADVEYAFEGEVPSDVTLPAGGTYEYGATVTVAAAPSAEGYTFDGWYNGTTPVAPGSTFTMGDEKVTLTGKWTKDVVKTYKVTFNAAGGTFTDGKTSWVYELKDGDPIVKPADTDLSREGYEFSGWTPTVPSNVDGEDLTFSAVWNVNDTRKNLVADANGGKYGDGTSVKNHKFNAGEMVDGAIEEPTRDGYEFAGWDGLNADGTMPSDDTTITAKWVAKVTIDPNGGKFADNSTAKIETTGTAIDVTGKLPVTKENANFLGWKDTLTGTVYDTIPATSDKPLNLVAQWDEMEQSTITYYVGANVHKTESYYEGDAIVLPAAPTVPGFDFEGWKLKDGTDVPATMGTEDLEAVAVLTPHKNDVRYYLDDAKTNLYKEYKDVAYGSEIEVPADPTHPTNPELVFAGWNPAVDSEMPDNDVEYVATWKEIEDEKYSAQFIANGKTHALHVLAAGDAIPEVPDPKKFGFVFVGWEPAVPETMPAQNMVFEAQWEIDKDFASIIIGGTVIGGGAIAGIIGTGAIIGGASIIGGILVLWGASEIAKNTFTVTYKVDGEVYKTYKVLAGTKVPVPADPTKDGCEFAGWNPEVPEKMPKKDLVFEAKWSADSDVDIPSTGSFSGMAAFAAISAASAIAFIATKKKKDEDEE